MHDDLFKKHIVDYLQRIIYNEEKKCLITRLFLSEYKALNIKYHFQKNHTWNTVINELIKEQFVWKGQQHIFG